MRLFFLKNAAKTVKNAVKMVKNAAKLRIFFASQSRFLPIKYVKSFGLVLHISFLSESRCFMFSFLLNLRRHEKHSYFQNGGSHHRQPNQDFEHQSPDHSEKLETPCTYCCFCANFSLLKCLKLLKKVIYRQFFNRKRRNSIYFSLKR